MESTEFTPDYIVVQNLGNVLNPRLPFSFMSCIIWNKRWAWNWRIGIRWCKHFSFFAADLNKLHFTIWVTKPGKKTVGERPKFSEVSNSVTNENVQIKEVGIWHCHSFQGTWWIEIEIYACKTQGEEVVLLVLMRANVQLHKTYCLKQKKRYKSFPCHFWCAECLIVKFQLRRTQVHGDMSPTVFKGRLTP